MLDKLNQYKEVITLVVFFLGGFFWIENQFPTKIDLTKQIGVLKCELDNYMKLTQLQIRSRDLEKSVQALDTDLEMPVAADIPPSFRDVIESKKSQRTEDVAALKVVNDQIASIFTDLGRQICGQ
ncbi:MAG TPA: hypothetical protein VGG69_12045 [Rhizomicrobium sp.]|jgi:hypothetical protein